MRPYRRSPEVKRELDVRVGGQKRDTAGEDVGDRDSVTGLLDHNPNSSEYTARNHPTDTHHHDLFQPQLFDHISKNILLCSVKFWCVSTNSVGSVSYRALETDSRSKFRRWELPAPE